MTNTPSAVNVEGTATWRCPERVGVLTHPRVGIHYCRSQVSVRQGWFRRRRAGRAGSSAGVA